MAAGGSAPELFTSLIGTFNESSIGFGTIVGSAVFNVLFVIGMCSLLSREVLTLTWWPLFRDSTYYSIGLLTLAIFVGVVSPGEIELWEAITLFVMYIGYVIAMAYNETLRDFFSRGSTRQSHGTTCTLEDNEQSTNRNQDTNSSMGRTEFKAGFLTLLLDPENWEMKTRVGLVSKIYGDAAEVFNTLDQNGDGTLCEEEFQTAMQNIEGNSLNRSSEEFSAVFNQIDKDRDGKVSSIALKKKE
jgi:sodium/potassium/calcium exchanger 2